MQTIPSICNSSMRGLSAQMSRCATAAALVEAARLMVQRLGGRPHELLDPRLGVKRFQRDCRKAIPTVERAQDTDEKARPRLE